MILFGHGYFGKVETLTIGGKVGFFASIGPPAITAYLVIGGEILGGIGLIPDTFTHLAAWLSGW